MIGSEVCIHSRSDPDGPQEFNYPTRPFARMSGVRPANFDEWLIMLILQAPWQFLSRFHDFTSFNFDTIKYNAVSNNRQFEYLGKFSIE